jgi:hypothetical protein
MIIQLEERVDMVEWTRKSEIDTLGSFSILPYQHACQVG